MTMDQTTLLVDANVLIDYRESEFNILGLVVQHIGRVVVLEPVLQEVRDITPAQCLQLGIDVVAVETERLVRALAIESRVSFNDRLNLVACLEDGWTCVTNDGTLQRLCERYGVATRFGLGLMVDLVAIGTLTRQHAIVVARRIQTSNPLHINERVLARFMTALTVHASS